MRNERIGMEDTIMSAVMKLAEGNPGAMRVCMELYKEAGNIDTDDFLGGFGSLLMLDSENIYGPQIWMLYKDICKESIWKTVAMLRACQLGFVSSSTLHHAIENYGDGINVDDLVKQVTGRLSGFKVPEEN
jgi:hypothetical protein